MNRAALERMDRRQLLELEFIALRFRAWVETALILGRLGIPNGFAMKRARQYKAIIERVTA